MSESGRRGDKRAAAAEAEGTPKRPAGWSVETSEACRALLNALEWTSHGIPPPILGERAKGLVEPIVDELKAVDGPGDGNAARVLKAVYAKMEGRLPIFQAMYAPVLDMLLHRLGGRPFLGRLKSSDNTIETLAFKMNRCFNHDSDKGRRELTTIFNDHDKRGAIPLYFRRDAESAADYAYRSDATFCRYIECTWPDAFVYNSVRQEHISTVFPLGHKRQSIIVDFVPPRFPAKLTSQEDRFRQTFWVAYDLDGPAATPSVAGHWLWMNPPFLQSTEATIAVSGHEVRDLITEWAQKQAELEGRATADDTFPFKLDQIVVVSGCKTPAEWINQCRAAAPRV